MNPNTTPNNVSVSPTIPLQTVANTVDHTPLRKKLLDEIRHKTKKGRNTLITLIGFGLVGLLAIFLILNSLFNVFYTKNIEVIVKDTNGLVIPNATVLFNNKEIGISSLEGRVVANNFAENQIAINVSASGYRQYNQLIDLSENDSKNINLEIVLSTENKSLISGKFIPSGIIEYSFVNDRILLNNQPYPIQPDGNISIDTFIVGEADFTFQSSNFRDFSTTINLSEGENSIGIIELVPAADITGSILSYIEEVKPANFEIFAEFVPTDGIEISDTTFYIKDLEIGREYNIQFSAENYLSQIIKVNTTQGLNTILDPIVVEDDVFYYTQKGARRNDIFSSNAYGLNPTKLTNFDSEFKKLEIIDGFLYFLTSYNTISTRNRTTGFDPYNINLASLTLNGPLLSGTRDKNYGELFPNYKQNEVIEVLTTDNKTSALNKINLGNKESTSWYQSTNVISSIAANGTDYIFAVANAGENSQVNIFDKPNSIKFSYSKPNISITSINNSGDSILILTNATSSNFLDLQLINANTQEVKTLITNANSKFHQFDSELENIVIYTKTIGNRNILYYFDLDTNTEREIISLSNVPITNIYQNGKYLIYETTDTIFVLNKYNPHANKILAKKNMD